ncbi:hypothetical protein F2P81_024925 [Scophthalmus maximus]|uniref:Uncharacterized protein n=1 Tax=Scophthalmus maximus TaxID=52904 RepID=A0A6A4RWW8_SCOMX|nr:hypothetical protein F2P81_024925 [Scophthalmus maximus]
METEPPQRTVEVRGFDQSGSMVGTASDTNVQVHVAETSSGSCGEREARYEQKVVMALRHRANQTWKTQRPKTVGYDCWYVKVTCDSFVAEFIHELVTGSVVLYRLEVSIRNYANKLSHSAKLRTHSSSAASQREMTFHTYTGDATGCRLLRISTQTLFKTCRCLSTLMESCSAVRHGQVEKGPTSSDK